MTSETNDPITGTRLIFLETIVSIEKISASPIVAPSAQKTPPIKLLVTISCSFKREPAFSNGWAIKVV